MYRVGGIGCGTIFDRAHAPAYAYTYGAKLVGFYDVNIKNAEFAMRNYANLLKDVVDGKAQYHITTLFEDSPIFTPTVDTPYSDEQWIEQCKENLNELKVYTDWRDLLENVDIVDVCTPPKWHVEYALRALEHNVNVMTEKPPDRSWWQARRLRDAVKKSKATYQYMDDNIYVESYKMFRHVIESGIIGDINYIELHRGSTAHWHERLANRWFWDPEVAGGGALMDYGSHASAATWFLAGYDKKIVEVKSQGIENKHKTRSIGGIYQKACIDDDAHIKVLFEDPRNKNWVTASIEASWSGPLKENNSLDLIGSDGEATRFVDENGKDFLKITRTSFGHSLRLLPKEIAELDSIKRGIQNFVMCVKEGKSSISNEEVAIGVMEILGSAYLSELRGRVSITPHEFREFCEETANKHPEDAPSAITKELMKPYQ